jgi:hypothetical protein
MDDAALLDVLRGHIETLQDLRDEAEARGALGRTETLDLMLAKYRGALEQYLLAHPDASTDEDTDYRQEEGGEA